MKRVIVLAALMTLAPVLPAMATATTIDIVINDAPGSGFNDTTPVAPVGGNAGVTLGAQRRLVFERAAEIWAAALTSSVPILIEAGFAPLTCDASSAVLGGAGTTFVFRDFPEAPFPDTWYHSALADALRGVDGAPGAPDASSVFNSAIDNDGSCLPGVNWYYGLDHLEGSDIDLLAVVLHELGHSLGFSGFIDLSTGALLDSRIDAFSRGLFDNTIGKLWSEMTDTERVASAVNNGGVVWLGPAVAAATDTLISGVGANGNPIVYAPATLMAGSSIAHFDITAAPDLLMEPVISRSLTDDVDLTDDVLSDMGWTVTMAADPPVPDDPAPRQVMTTPAASSAALAIGLILVAVTHMLRVSGPFNRPAVVSRGRRLNRDC